eukprot:3851968-Rhodomonas_salina.1
MAVRCKGRREWTGDLQGSGGERREGSSEEGAGEQRQEARESGKERTLRRSSQSSLQSLRGRWYRSLLSELVRRSVDCAW